MLVARIISDPEQTHMGLPPIAPGASFQVSSGPSEPVWAGLIIRVPVYSSVTIMLVPGHGPHWSRPWSMDCFPVWPQPSLISMHTGSVWPRLPPPELFLTCGSTFWLDLSWAFSLWIWLCLILTGLSGGLDCWLTPAAGAGPALLPPLCPEGQSPCWLGPCPASLVTVLGSLSCREQLAHAASWH